MPAVMFTKVRDSNDWWTWFDKTLLPNVRVQLWYNQAPPYRLRGYLDDRVNRLIGYAIVRQVSVEKFRRFSLLWAATWFFHLCAMPSGAREGLSLSSAEGVPLHHRRVHRRGGNGQ